MKQIYALVWAKLRSCLKDTCLGLSLLPLCLPSQVHAAPTGGTVVGGTGTISQSGTQTTINQATQNMAIDWQSYYINSNDVYFEPILV